VILHALPDSDWLRARQNIHFSCSLLVEELPVRQRYWSGDLRCEDWISRRNRSATLKP
jgi:hypothetical protein